MSNQGNVVVLLKYKQPNAENYFIFTSTRWSGPEMPSVVRKCLRDDNGPGYVDESDFLRSLCHEDSIDRPIKAIGNCDVPTVIIDFDLKYVAWTHEEDVGDQVARDVIASWSFEEYLDLKLDSPLWEKHFGVFI